jgi:hypothetical protein
MLQIGLQLDRAYNDERKRLLGMIPKDYMIEAGERRGPARELLLTEGVVTTNLIPTEIYNTVIDGSKPRRCAMDACQVIPMSSDIENVPLGGTEEYAPEVPQGAKIPQNNDNYSYRALTAIKYAELPSVTREMIDDGAWGMLEREYMMAGRRIQNSINRKWIISLADNAGNEHDANGSNWGYAAVIAAMKECEKDGFIPDTLVLSPEAAYKLRADLVPSSSNPGAGDEAIRTGYLPTLGMKFFVCGISTAATAGMPAGTQTWAYAADSNIGMIIMDSFAGACVGQRQDIMVEEYKDPIRDLAGAKVTWRGCPSYLQSNAVCRVEY